MFILLARGEETLYKWLHLSQPGCLLSYKLSCSHSPVLSCLSPFSPLCAGTSTILGRLSLPCKTWQSDFPKEEKSKVPQNYQVKLNYLGCYNFLARTTWSYFHMVLLSFCEEEEVMFPFPFVCWLVLSADVHKNYGTNFHEAWMEDGPEQTLLTFGYGSGWREWSSNFFLSCKLTLWDTVGRFPDDFHKFLRE